MPPPTHASQHRPELVWVAADDDAMNTLLAAYFDRAGVDVEILADGKTLRSRLTKGALVPALLVSDSSMPGWSPLEALRWLRQHHPSTRVVVIAPFGDRQARARAEELGAAAVFDQPFDWSRFRETVLALLEH